MNAASDRPTWAQRICAERAARGWSQVEAVNALRAHAQDPLPRNPSLLRNWKRWESGEVEPDEFYKSLIAKTFGTVTAAFFPSRSRRSSELQLAGATGLDTLELVSRLRASDVSPGTLDALRITADHLCCEYPYADSTDLHRRGQGWLNQIVKLLDRRLTFSQHRQILSAAGWVTLLLGCVEYDMGKRASAEASRRAAWSLGKEADDREVMAWAQEMRAWFALTHGDYRGVLAAAEQGVAVSRQTGATVQLLAQSAKAWARIGDRRQVEVALNTGRDLLEGLPHPDNLDHHFDIDPSKFDFYVMDCYRVLHEDRLAEVHAQQVIRSSTDFDGTDRKPMRSAEAHVTLGVVAARSQELEQAVAHGRQALSGARKSLPSLLLCTRELAESLRQTYPNEPHVRAYVEELGAYSRA